MRQREEKPGGSRDDVEGPLRPTSVHGLAKVDQAHEPRRRELLDRDTAERVLEEPGESDDSSGRLRAVEEAIHRLPVGPLVGDDDEIRALGLDDVCELFQTSRERDATLSLGSVADAGDQLEVLAAEHVELGRQHVRQLVCSDHERSSP